MRRRWTLPLILLAAGAVIIGGLVVYNRTVEDDVNSQLWIPRAIKMTPEIARLQEYVRIDTSKNNEIDGARYLAAILARQKIPAEIIESAPGRANLYARIKGKHDGDALLLLNHIDVVAAPPQGWSHPPFAAEAQLNFIWGRGTLDMKGIAVCQLEAFLDVARSGRVPERDLVFLATADEENDGVLGVRWLLEHRPDLFHGVRYALNEGGVTETLQERVSYFGIETGTIGLRSGCAATTSAGRATGTGSTSQKRAARSASSRSRPARAEPAARCASRRRISSMTRTWPSPRSARAEARRMAITLRSSSAAVFPRLPPGMMTQSGTPQSNCWTVSMLTVFWPSTRSEFIEFAR